MQKVTANVTANVDAAALPSGLGSPIKFGTKGTLTLSPGSANPFSIKCMVTKVHWASAVEGLITYNFDVESDETNAGSITYPT